MIAGNNSQLQQQIHNQICEFREAFTLFDVTGAVGAVESVTCDSFLEVMALFGETAAVEAEKLLAIIDESGDGEIDFVEFLSLMVSRNATIQEIVRSQIVSYREMFHLFDEDADGCVSDDDILNTLHRLGMRRVTHPQVTAMILAALPDVDPAHIVIRFNGFVHLVAKERSAVGSVMSQISELREAFSMYDTDGSGALDADEIVEALAKLGVQKTTEEADAMIATVDPEETGEIGFNQFVKLMVREEDVEEFAAKRVDTADPHLSLQDLLNRTEPNTNKRGDAADSIYEILVNTMQIPFFAEMERSICMHLCKTMSFVQAGPSDFVARQAKPSGEFFILIRGTVDVWTMQSFFGEFQRDRLRNQSTWGVVQKGVKSFLASLLRSLGRLPSAGSTNLNTPQLRDMVTQLGMVHADLKGWLKNACDECVGDLDDVCGHAKLMKQGEEILVEIEKLVVLLDDVRREHVLKRSNMQLQGDTGVEFHDVEVMLNVCKEALAHSYEIVNALVQVFRGNKEEVPLPPFSVHNPSTSDSTAHLDDEVLGKHLARLVPGDWFGNLGFSAVAGDSGIEKHVSSVTTQTVEGMTNEAAQAKWREAKTIIRQSNSKLIALEKQLLTLAHKTPLDLGMTVQEHYSARLTAEQEDHTLRKQMAASNKVLEQFGALVARVSRQEWLWATIQEPLEFLRTLPAFQKLRNVELHNVAANLVKHTLGRRERFIEVGCVAAHVYILLQGEVKLLAPLNDNKQELQVGDRDSSGEPAPLCGKALIRPRPRCKEMAVLRSPDIIYEAHRKPGRYASKTLYYAIEAEAHTEPTIVYSLPREVWDKYPKIMKYTKAHSVTRTQLRNERISDASSLRLSGRKPPREPPPQRKLPVTPLPNRFELAYGDDMEIPRPSTAPQLVSLADDLEAPARPRLSRPFSPFAGMVPMPVGTRVTRFLPADYAVRPLGKVVTKMGNIEMAGDPPAFKCVPRVVNQDLLPSLASSLEGSIAPISGFQMRQPAPMATKKVRQWSARLADKGSFTNSRSVSPRLPMTGVAMDLPPLKGQTQSKADIKGGQSKCPSAQQSNKQMDVNEASQMTEVAAEPDSPRWDELWQSSGPEPASNCWVAGPSRDHSDSSNVVMPLSHQLYSKPHFSGGIRMHTPTSIKGHFP